MESWIINQKLVCKGDLVKVLAKGVEGDWVSIGWAEQLSDNGLLRICTSKLNGNAQYYTDLMNECITNIEVLHAVNREPKQEPWLTSGPLGDLVKATLKGVTKDAVDHRLERGDAVPGEQSVTAEVQLDAVRGGGDDPGYPTQRVEEPGRRITWREFL